VYHVLFTPYLSLVLIDRPQRDGTLSWRWYTAAAWGSNPRPRGRKSGTVLHGHRVPYFTSKYINSNYTI